MFSTHDIMDVHHNNSNDDDNLPLLEEGYDTALLDDANNPLKQQQQQEGSKKKKHHHHHKKKKKRIGDSKKSRNTHSMSQSDYLKISLQNKIHNQSKHNNWNRKRVMTILGTTVLGGGLLAFTFVFFTILQSSNNNGGGRNDTRTTPTPEPASIFQDIEAIEKKIKGYDSSSSGSSKSSSSSSDSIGQTKTSGITSQGDETHPSFVYQRPLVVVDNGCEGSTAVMRQLIILLNAHGLKTIGHEWEILKPNKNYLYGKLINHPKIATLPSSMKNVNVDAMVQSIQSIHQSVIDTYPYNGYLTFKMNNGEYKALSSKVSQVLQPIYVGTYRENSLDKCVCLVRDCFNSNVGYPVFGVNGTKTDLCFQRRKSDAKIKAYFYSNKLVNNCIQKNMDHIQEEKKMSILSFVASEETLFEYEYSSDINAMKRSISAWSGILKPYLGDFYNENVVSNTLKETQNSRGISYHDDVIQNLEDVKKVLYAHNMGSLLRIMNE